VRPEREKALLSGGGKKKEAALRHESRPRKERERTRNAERDSQSHLRNSRCCRRTKKGTSANLKKKKREYPTTLKERKGRGTQVSKFPLCRGKRSGHALIRGEKRKKLRPS